MPMLILVRTAVKTAWRAETRGKVSVTKRRGVNPSRKKAASRVAEFMDGSLRQHERSERAHLHGVHIQYWELRIILKVFAFMELPQLNPIVKSSQLLQCNISMSKSIVSLKWVVWRVFAIIRRYCGTAIKATSSVTSTQEVLYWFILAPYSWMVWLTTFAYSCSASWPPVCGQSVCFAPCG